MTAAALRGMGFSRVWGHPAPADMFRDSIASHYSNARHCIFESNELQQGPGGQPALSDVFRDGIASQYSSPC